MRTQLACPDPPPRPVVTRYTNGVIGATTVADISDWPGPPTTTGATSWARLDLNTPEDRRAA